MAANVWLTVRKSQRQHTLYQVWSVLVRRGLFGM